MKTLRLTGRATCGHSHLRGSEGRTRGCLVQAAPQAEVGAAAGSDSKARLLSNLDGVNRGIFGVKAQLQAEIDADIAHLEAQSPTAEPLADLSRVHGRWRMLYSSIRILGTKRSRLGLREFVQVGDIWQDIDTENKQAANSVEFRIAGFPGASNFAGALEIKAGFDIKDVQTAQVTFERAQLQPQQLNKLFDKHMDMLLSIFNPEGELTVTYLDDTWRIGRDDKGNVFVLEKAEHSM